jgi:hypothetical protein
MGDGQRGYWTFYCLGRLANLLRSHMEVAEQD